MKGSEVQSALKELHDLGVSTVNEDTVKLLDVIRRQSGRLCLICGRDRPCEETPEACTFDPFPVAAAQGFLARARAAEGVTKALQCQAKWNDLQLRATLQEKWALERRLEEINTEFVNKLERELATNLDAMETNNRLSKVISLIKAWSESRTINAELALVDFLGEKP